MGPIASVVAGAIKPLAELIEGMHTSTEEKGKLRLAMAEVQVATAQSLLDYEAKQLEQRAKLIMAEAQGASWLQRSWRPITMLVFLALVVADQTGYLAFRLAPEAWSLLQLGLGGYVVGRSAEKVVPQIAAALAGDVARKK